MLSGRGPDAQSEGPRPEFLQRHFENKVLGKFIVGLFTCTVKCSLMSNITDLQDADLTIHGGIISVWISLFLRHAVSFDVLVCFDGC